MSSTLTFLDEAARRELTLRIVRARETEDARHRKRVEEITADHSRRGVLQSGMYYGACRDEAVHHQRELTRITREQLFEILANRRIRLRDSHVECIRQYLREALTHAMEQVRRELGDVAMQVGLMGEDTTLVAQFDQVVSREAFVEVEIRAGDLRRTFDAERRAWWFKRGERLLWILVGAVGTLLARSLPGLKDLLP